MKLSFNSFILSEEKRKNQIELKEDHEFNFGKLSDIKNYKSYQSYQKMLVELEIKFQKEIDRFNLNDIHDVYSDLIFPKDLNIEIFFVDKEYFNKTLILDFFDGSMSSELLGCAVLSGGLNIIRSDECFMNDKFQVIVCCQNDQEFNDEIKKSGLFSTLNTLTHEIFHHILFLRTSGGMTPHEVDCSVDSGLFDFNVFECSIGATHIVDDGFETESFLYLDLGKQSDIMEEYIEHKSYLLTQSLECLNSISFNEFIRN